MRILHLLSSPVWSGPAEPLALLAEALPAGYADAIDPTWGLEREATGFYRTTAAYSRAPNGNVVGQRDGLGVTQSVQYDTDGQFPIRLDAGDGERTEGARRWFLAVVAEVVVALDPAVLVEVVRRRLGEEL